MSQMSARQQNQQFSDYRQLQYEQLSSNYSKLFNFFYENNDIFKFISDEDANDLQTAHMDYLNTTLNWTLGTFGSVLFMDQIFFRYVYPIKKYPSLRFCIFTGKYIALPLIGFKIGKDYFATKTDEIFRGMAEKYSFNYYDYQRAMDVLERAERVGRLEELMQKGQEFDWTGVPKFQSKITKQLQEKNFGELN